MHRTIPVILVTVVILAFLLGGGVNPQLQMIKPRSRTSATRVFWSPLGIKRS